MSNSMEVQGIVVLGEPRRLGGLTILVESTKSPRKMFVKVTPIQKVRRGQHRRKHVDRREEPGND